MPLDLIEHLQHLGYTVRSDYWIAIRKKDRHSFAIMCDIAGRGVTGYKLVPADNQLRIRHIA